MSGEDVLVPVALEAASEEGSPMISPSPSGSLHCAEASSPSGSVRQHGELATHCFETPYFAETDAQCGRYTFSRAEQCMSELSTCIHTNKCCSRRILL